MDNQIKNTEATIEEILMKMDEIIGGPSRVHCATSANSRRKT